MIRPFLSQRILRAPDGAGSLAYDFDRAVLHRLNAHDSSVLDLCDGVRERDEIVRLVVEDIGAEHADATAEWLDRAVESGLLRNAASNGRDVAPTAQQLRKKAAALRAAGDLTGTYLCCARAVELEPERVGNWSDLGDAARIIGRRAEARAAYERYLSSVPDDAEVIHLLDALSETVPKRASDACITRLYRRFASFYDSNMREELEYRAPELLTAALTAAWGEGPLETVLDLGCGTGFWGHTIRRRARSLIGIDLSPEMLEKARKRRMYTRLDQAEATAWLAAERSERFDWIGICDTLIYFGDLRQVLPAACRLLKPGGVLGFTVERGETYPFAFTDSGRFTHHPDHLREVGAETDCRFVTCETAVIRREYGTAVAGMITVLAKPHH